MDRWWRCRAKLGRFEWLGTIYLRDAARCSLRYVRWLLYMGQLAENHWSRYVTIFLVADRLLTSLQCRKTSSQTSANCHPPGHTNKVQFQKLWWEPVPGDASGSHQGGKGSGRLEWWQVVPWSVLYSQIKWVIMTHAHHLPYWRCLCIRHYTPTGLASDSGRGKGQGSGW